MILKRSLFSSRHYQSDETEPVHIEIRWSRSLGGFSRDGELTVGNEVFELRTESAEIWLTVDDESRGYAKGTATHWSIDLDDRKFELIQPSFGRSISDLTDGEETVGQIRAADRLLRKVLVNVSENVSIEHQAFIAAVAIRGWRETLAGLRAKAHGSDGLDGQVVD